MTLIDSAISAIDKFHEDKMNPEPEYIAMNRITARRLSNLCRDGERCAVSEARYMFDGLHILIMPALKDGDMYVGYYFDAVRRGKK